MQRPHRHLLNRRRAARGVGLLDGLIALAILAFGLLGMTRLQSNVVKQATDGQARLTAAQLGDELLSTALVDLGNAACYTVPVDDGCASDAARARTEDWAERVAASLPGSAGATAERAGDRLTVTISWTDKAASEARTLRVTTDVRE